jgi:hypothetical protein
MARQKSQSGEKNPVKRAASSVAGVVTRAKKKITRQAKAAEPAPRKAAAAVPRKERLPERAIHREADIPLDQLAGTYTPTQTSLKASFRADGADRHRDQEFANGAGDARWNDEDRLTNKSGDPRIGTHGRTYEPGESPKEERR